MTKEFPRPFTIQIQLNFVHKPGVCQNALPEGNFAAHQELEALVAEIGAFCRGLRS